MSLVFWFLLLTIKLISTISIPQVKKLGNIKKQQGFSKRTQETTRVAHEKCNHYYQYPDLLSWLKSANDFFLVTKPESGISRTKRPSTVNTYFFSFSQNNCQWFMLFRICLEMCQICTCAKCSSKWEGGVVSARLSWVEQGGHTQAGRVGCLSFILSISQQLT